MHPNPMTESELEALFETGVPEELAGDIVPLPSMSLLIEEKFPVQPPAPVPTKDTGEVRKAPPELLPLRIGSPVTLPDGTRVKVWFISPDLRRVGVGKRKGKDYTFFSFEEIETISGKKVAADMQKEKERDREEQGEPPPTALTRVWVEGKTIFVETPYNADFVAALKDGIANPADRRWDGSRKVWTVYHTAEHLGIVGRLIKEFYGETVTVDGAEVVVAEPPVDLPAKLPKGLYPWQVESIAFVLKHNGAIVGDEPGLGKTITAAVCIESPAVVVCPAQLKVNWNREIARWRPELTTAMIEGTSEPDDPSVKAVDVVIINYEILQYHSEWLIDRKVHTLIADEAHYLKTFTSRWNKAARRSEVVMGPGKTSRRSAAFHAVSLVAERILLMTGTPILNRAKEIWPLLFILDPRRWWSFNSFCMRYCAGHTDTRGHRNCNGRSNTEELHDILVKRYMVRHVKAEVELDLPEKMRGCKLVGLSPEYKKHYNKAARDFLGWVKEHHGAKAVVKAQRAEMLTKLTKLRELSAVGKADAVAEEIVTHFQGTQRPLVLMAVHTKAFARIKECLSKINDEYHKAKAKDDMPPICRPIRFDEVVGGQSPKKRQKVIDAFQEEGTLDVLLYSIPIATGTTLTRSQDMFFLERLWRPSDQTQAEDRCHRIGQKNAVKVTYFDAEGTIDGKMALLLMEKAETASEIIDGVKLSTEMAALLVFGEMMNIEADFMDSLEEMLDDADSLVGEKFDGEKLNRNTGYDDDIPMFPVRDIYKNGEWVDYDSKSAGITPNSPGDSDLEAMADSSWYDAL